MFGIGGIFTGIGAAAKALFSGDAKAARQERKATKKAAKEAAQEAKAIAKKAIAGGSNAGAQVGDFFAKVVTWFKKNWQIIAIVIGAIVAIYFLFKTFGKKRGAPRRRRSGASRGSSAMKARMAKVRAARRRKRK